MDVWRVFFCSRVLLCTCVLFRVIGDNLLLFCGMYSGFLRRGTRSVTDVDECAIAMPQLNDKYTELRRALIGALLCAC
jgi:hypothetical protein